MKNLLFLCGPNGIGKTPHAKQSFKGCIAPLMLTPTRAGS